MLLKFCRGVSQAVYEGLYNSSKYIEQCSYGPKLRLAKSYKNHQWRFLSFSDIKKLKVRVKHIEINYETSGSKGRVALCLPGSMGCAETDFAPQLKGLGGDKLQIICWDPPGYGKSRPPSRQFSLDMYEDDANVAAMMMKELGHEKYSLLGWSDGGITSLIMAASNPEHIEKMVVWGANAFIHEGDIKAYEAHRDVEKWSDRMRAPMEALYGKEYFRTTWEMWIDTMIDIYKRRGGDICKSRLKDIVCPTLIIHGKKDNLVDESHPQYLHNHIKGSRYVLWDDGKHNLHLKYANEFNQLVQDFLNE